MRKTAYLLSVILSMSVVAQCQNTGIGTLSPTDQLHTTGTLRLENYRGPGTRLMLIDSSGRLQVTGAGGVQTSLPAAAIPDNGCAAGNGVTSTQTVVGLPTAVASSKISVRVNITHARDGDVVVFLVAPNGNVIRLIENYGGTSQTFTNTIFSDEAVNFITGTSNNGFNGVYKPKGLLTTSCLIAGTVNTFGAIGGGTIVPNGNWTLKVYDNSSTQTGTLNRWDLSFTGPNSFNTSEENNYIPKFNAGNLDPSLIYQSPTSNIGINTNSPAYKLTVSSPGAGIVHRDALNNVEIGTYTNANSGWLQTYTNHPLSFSTNNAGVLMQLSTGGDFGIGTNTADAAARLEVSSSTVPIAQFTNTTGLNAGINNDIYFKTGTMYTGLIRTRGTATNAAAIAFSTNATPAASGLIERLTILDNGNVGVGNIAPSTKLDINGQLRMQGGTPGIGKLMTSSDATGTAKWQDKVAFRSFVTSSITSSGAPLLPVTGYTEVYDDGNDFNPSTGIFTVPQDGLYHFDAAFRVQDVGSDDVLFVQITTQQMLTAPCFYSNIAASQYMNTQVSDNFELVAGDQVSIRVYMGNGNGFRVLGVATFSNGLPTGRSIFSGYLIR